MNNRARNGENQNLMGDGEVDAQTFYSNN